MSDLSVVSPHNLSIRVLVVEDHHVVRQGLVALLNVADGLEVVGEAADGVEAIAQFRKCQPDITLDDLRLPRLSGVEVIERIRMETPTARFIVLTTYDGDEDIYRALQAGARAYLLKGMTSEELIATIRSVHSGKSYIPPAIAAKLAERLGTEELTPRELDVLEQIVHGKNNNDIATELKISETTVKTHINRLLGKLGRGGPHSGGHVGNSARPGPSRGIHSSQSPRGRSIEIRSRHQCRTNFSHRLARIAGSGVAPIRIARC
jgi:DNA-binding NarL/FixJ family response regulator